jgi:hypothetical protein
MRKLIVQQWVTVDNIAAEEDGGLSFDRETHPRPNETCRSIWSGLSQAASSRCRTATLAIRPQGSLFVDRGEQVVSGTVRMSPQIVAEQ